MKHLIRLFFIKLLDSLEESVIQISLLQRAFLTPLCIFLILCLFNAQKLAYVDDKSEKAPQFIQIKPIIASKNLASYNPRTFRSNSGSIHLLFSHDVQIYDYYRIGYYHTYESRNRTWSIPQKVSNDIDTIFNISESKNGFIVYYYNKGIENRDFRGLCRKDYDEQLNHWFDDVLLFGRPQIIDYLDLSQNESGELVWWVHSFLLKEDESISICWSFDFSPISNFTNDYTELYIVSEVYKNGSIVTQPIQGLEGQYRSLEPLTFVQFENSLFLYSQNYEERAVLLSNGTWSSWQDSGIIQNYYYFDDSILITNRYLFCRVSKTWEDDKGEETPSTLALLDLASENLDLSSKLLDIPHNPNTSLSYGVDFEVDTNDFARPVFTMGLITNDTIELWEFNYTNDNWHQINLIKFNVNKSHTGRYFRIDLMKDGTNWRLFWDQEIGQENLQEIFTITYNGISDEWSPVTQVTDTNTIINDYYTEDFNPTLPKIDHIVFGIFVLICVGILFISIRFSLKRKVN